MVRIAKTQHLVVVAGSALLLLLAGSSAYGKQITHAQSDQMKASTDSKNEQIKANIDERDACKTACRVTECQKNCDSKSSKDEINTCKSGCKTYTGIQSLSGDLKSCLNDCNADVHEKNKALREEHNESYANIVKTDEDKAIKRQNYQD